MSRYPSPSCGDYRLQMIILSLRRQLQRPDMSPEERKQLLERLQALEAEADMQ